MQCTHYHKFIIFFTIGGYVSEPKIASYLRLKKMGSFLVNSAFWGCEFVLKLLSNFSNRSEPRSTYSSGLRFL